MRKYLAIFKMALLNSLEYRFDFIMGRVRSFIILLTLYFLWQAVYAGRSNVAGVDKEQAFLYVVVSTVIFEAVALRLMDKIAYDINSGQLSSYLLKPVNYLAYWFVSSLAQRITVIFFVFLEIFLFILLVNPSLGSIYLTTSFWLMLFLGFTVFTLSDFSAGLSAFWANWAYGPRFFYNVLSSLASGQYFPLYILPFGLGKMISLTFFAYITYLPALFLSGQPVGGNVWLLGVVWVVVLAVLLKVIWRKGLKVYEAYGS